ncbi:EPIDERMAL PATTERNING FACTOR-like protein 4 [Canna indica]|uniref:Epidermal patterning factor-like protein n=1 Tax=Canna indica TaxID=4628 RepID=A0AAQ3JR73_9LILI|nr:EPIDERMAL PATTERNING FACTOR-like protein 4 [Canna indica]
MAEITSWRTDSISKVLRQQQETEAMSSPAAGTAMGRRMRRRRSLAGLGSHPPRCASKCGGCTPCWPVHVPVPPRAPADAAEYYPEAWRCQCGGRLYVP